MFDYEDQLADDVLMYELDMERFYEDEAFTLDEINAELQEVAQDLQAQEVEQAYDDMLASLFRSYINLDLI